MQTDDELKRLLNQYRQLAESPENQRRLGAWELERVARDQWHGRPRADSFRLHGTVPVTVDLQNDAWLRFFPQDLGATFREGAAYLRFFLQRRIEQFRRLADDTPLDRVIPIYLGTPFEASMFGVPVEYFAHRDPILGRRQIVSTAADLDRLDEVDFHRSGMMPVAHRLYDEILAIAGDDFTVVFAEWLRGPLGLAQYVRGYDDMLADLAGDPELAAEIMARLTAARQRWFAERAKFLGAPIPPGSIFNDEVDSAVISPRHYRDLVLPHECALAAFHGAISYWHSCGNIGPMTADILRLGEAGPIEMLDVSAWTDLAEVLRHAPRPPARLEVRFHPLRDVLEASPERMQARIATALRLCREFNVGALTLRSSAIQPHGSQAEDLAAIARWLDTARRSIERA